MNVAELLLNQIDAKIAEAVSEERERCAKIAEAAFSVPEDSHDEYGFGMYDAGKEIAAEIRFRAPQNPPQEP